MRWRKTLFWSAFGLLSLLVAAVSWLLLADLGSFKPQIERWASEATGRRIAIDGDLQINLARHSSLLAEDIHVSNADWAEEAEMISVGRLEVRLDLGSIWRGPIVVELVDLDDATIFLDKPADGDPNWKLGGRATQEPAPERDQKGLLLQQVNIDRLHLTYRAAQRDAPIRVFIEQLSQQHRDDDFLELSLQGAINERPVRIAGEAGSWAALLAGQDVQFDLDASLDTFRFNGSGEIDNLLRPSRPRINFSAQADDVNDLLQVLGAREEGEGIIDLTGSLLPADGGPLALDIKGELGRLELEARGEFSDLQHFEDMDIDLHANGADIRPILQALGMRQSRHAPFRIDVAAERHGKTFVIEQAELLFGDAEFGLSARIPNFPDIDDSVIALQIHGPDAGRFREIFNLPGAATGAFAIGLTIDAGDDGVEILDFDLQSSLARLRANGRLGAGPQYLGSTLNFELASDSLATLAEAYGVPNLPDEPVSVSGSGEYRADGIRTQDSVTVTMRDVVLEIDGLVKTANKAAGTDLEFRLRGEQLSGLVGYFADSQYVPVLPYDLSGRLQIEPGGYRLGGVSGKLGTSDLAIDGLLVPAPGIAGSRFDVTAAGPDMQQLTAVLQDIEFVPGAYELAGRIEFNEDRIRLRDTRLHRSGGDLALNVDLGLPAARDWLAFEVRASGPDVRQFLRRLRGFEAAAAPFAVDLKGERNGSRWTVSRMKIGVADATLTASGDLDLAGDRSATKFDLQLDIPGTAQLGRVAGKRLREQRVALQASVNGRGNELRVEKLVATLGSSDIRGNVRLLDGEVPELIVELKSNALIFAPLLEPPDDQPDEVPVAKPVFEDGRIIPDIEIPFAAMARLNASVALDIGELQRDALHLFDVHLQAGLRAGALELEALRLRASSGALAARGQLAPEGGAGSAALELVARDFATGLAAQNKDLAVRSDVDIKLSARGADLRTLLATANGAVFARMGGGRITSNRFLSALYGNMLDQILDTINPFRKSEEYTQLECVVLPLAFDTGVITSNPGSLLRTDKIQVVTSPVIGLQDESLQISVRTMPKKGVSISAGEIVNPYVKIVGTLAKPRLAVDEKGVLVTGGVAVATGGLSILAQAAWTRLSRAKDPCEETRQKGHEALADRLPDLQLAAADAAP